jgi:hypothetical protein
MSEKTLISTWEQFLELGLSFPRPEIRLRKLLSRLSEPSPPLLFIRLDENGVPLPGQELPQEDVDGWER